MRTMVFVCCVVTAGLLACTLTMSGYAQKVPQKIILLHTNDMHAKIDNLPRLAYLKDSLEKSNPFVFLIAAGDNFTGNPVVDMVDDKGYPMIDLMNHCGFDLSVLGNHEFDLGQRYLNKRMLQARFPFICANINTADAVLIQPPAYQILSIGDSIFIAFVGLIQRGQNAYPDSHPLNMAGLKFYDDIRQARKYLVLKERYGNLIALTHLGIDMDQHLADSVPEFDLIVGGHSHTKMETPEIRNGVTIVQAGSHLRWIGKTSFTLHQGKITGITYEIITLQSPGREKNDIRELVDKYNDNDELNTIVAEAIKPLKGYPELGSLMTDALTRQLNADIAFVNRGGIRTDSLEKGPIRKKDVFRLDPFGNKVILCMMNLEEVKGLICSAYNMNKQLDLETSGLKYVVREDHKGHCAEVVVTLDPSLKTPSGEYLVAFNSYLASTYAFNHSNDFQTLDITTAQVLMDFLLKVKTVNYQGVKRIAVSGEK